MSRFAFAVLALVLLAGDGLLFGLWTDRWNTSSALPSAAASLQKVPMTIGDWQGKQLSTLPDRVLAQAGFAGYLNRRYENHTTGAVVDVLLACGPFGPLSVHSPEICLAGSGLVQEGGTALHKENPTPLGTTSSFRKAKFGKPDAAVPAHAWVYWGWNAGDGWQAPEHPRWSFAGAPVVYKLYLVAPDVRADEPTGVDHGQEFLRILLPELAKNLAFKS